MARGEGTVSTTNFIIIFFLDIYFILIYSTTAPQLFVGPWPLFQFLNLYIVGRTDWTGDQPVERPLSTHRTTQTQNKYTQTYMPRVGLETTNPVF
jgi:hypothetical protein